MAGAGYDHKDDGGHVESTEDNTQSTRGFVLQDDDAGDKFVIKV